MQINNKLEPCKWACSCGVCLRRRNSTRTTPTIDLLNTLLSFESCIYVFAGSLGRLLLHLLSPRDSGSQSPILGTCDRQCAMSSSSRPRLLGIDSIFERMHNVQTGSFPRGWTLRCYTLKVMDDQHCYEFSPSGTAAVFKYQSSNLSDPYTPAECTESLKYIDV